MNRVTIAKSLVAVSDLEFGAVIDKKMVAVKSPGRGLQPNHLNELIGIPIQRKIRAGDCFYPSDRNKGATKARNYSFQRPWGLPVRYHDFESILKKSNPDFLEFHLSYKDMDEDISRFFQRTYDEGLVVHSPDTFEGDHLLNLCDPDPVLRHRSVKELQRVVEVTRDLKKFFPRAMTPLVVASVGGDTCGRI